MNTSGPLRWLTLLGGGFVALLVVAAISFKIFQPIQVLPRIRLSPGFSMIDQAGQRLTNEDLRGQIVLYNFAYTRCGEPCASMESTMVEVQDGLDALDLAGISVRLVTVSVDPGYDTPPVMQAYARQSGADPERWTVATVQDPALLKYVVGGGFEAFYEAQADGVYRLDPKFVLVDGWGIIRGEYTYLSRVPPSERILRHIGVLVEEVQKSIGATRLAYEAAHLFLCYAP